MLYKTRGIVLRAIPYKETYYIIYMYTEAFGRVSYLVSRGRGKKSGVMRSLFIPLSVLELEVEHLNRREMQRIKEARLCLGANEWNGNPVKSVLALFLSEVLFRFVKDTEPDERLFRFLYDSIQVLEGADEGMVKEACQRSLTRSGNISFKAADRRILEMERSEGRKKIGVSTVDEDTRKKKEIRDIILNTDWTIHDD